MEAPEGHEDAAERGLTRRKLAALPVNAALAIGATVALGDETRAPVPSRGRRMSAEDRMDITELSGRNVWSYDCSDAEAVAATFTPDGVIEGIWQRSCPRSRGDRRLRQGALRRGTRRRRLAAL
jgi:hypothetical protein